MEHKSSNFRHFNCLSFSVVLHSLLIVGLGLAPAMMLLKKGDEGKAIEVAVVGTEAPAVVAPPVVVAPAAIPAPAPTPAVAIAPAPKPAAKKPVAKKVAPIQQTVEAQPVVEVANTVSEDAPVVADSDSKEEPLPEKEEIKEEAAPVAAEVVAEQIVEEQKPEKIEALKVEEQKPVQQIAQEELKKVAPVATKATEGTGNGQQGTVAQTAPIATAAAPQNFLNLKQTSGNKPPQYSRDMRYNKLEGRGQLQYYVTKTGTVSQLKVMQSSGNPELDRAAVDAFSKYKFVPGQEGYTIHNFEFTLKGPAEADAGRLRTTYK